MFSLINKKSTLKKICIVTETWEPEINGVARTIGIMAEHFLKKGMKLQLIRPKQGEVNTDSRVTELLTPGFQLPFYQQVRISLPKRHQIKQLWSASPPDIVIIVTEGMLGLSALRLAKRMGIPVVSEFHTHFEHYSHYYHFGFIYPFAMSYLRWFHNQSDNTLVATKALKQDMETKGFHNVDIVTRGIDSNKFDPKFRSDELRAQWGLGHDDLGVLFVGRLAPEKNVPLAIKAFAALHAKSPTSKLILVGDGPIREKLAQAHPEIIFCGMQTGVDLAAHYSSADIFLSPSMSETFGNTLLEAMASGLPTVSFDYAAAKNHVCHETNGLKVAFNDESTFIDAAVSLATQNEQRDIMGINARLTASLNGWDEICNDYLTIMKGHIQENTHHDPVIAST
ncbi:MAG: Glycoside hydrolase [uncultured Thiotrichaceae bacterium]|uniref:Glycoside hydrolase n=1 Tax=uncultured Thiotrichaceae bacterium TaxID=298394 RepID=A0A6S6SKP9_9GAMM|nr:MAG: Glycoside hydrolase [uncultured Thiotrichaceae bacterium]